MGVITVASINHYVMPKFLFRFRGIGRPTGEPDDRGKLDQELGTITDGYLWGAPFNQMNDPMEGFFTLDSLHRDSERMREAITMIRDNKLNLGLCCFNERPDNELMWAHYADQFYGICIAYNFRALLDGLPEGVTFSKISYSEEIPKTTDGRGMAGYDHKAKTILSTKNHRWAYEREWRMFGELRRNHYVPKLFKPVAKVYIGNRVNADWTEYIASYLRPHTIPVERITVEGYSINLGMPHEQLSTQSPIARQQTAEPTGRKLSRKPRMGSKNAS
jgi:hypothetical protein